MATESRLLPRFRAYQERIADLQKVGQIILEAGVDSDEAERRAGVRLYRRSADGHNRDRARGLPIVGRAAGGGASPGTDPVQALLRKEAQRERRGR